MAPGGVISDLSRGKDIAGSRTMKIRRRDQTTTPGLPPPPAPTARDANPWPLSTAPRAAPAARPASESNLGTVPGKTQTVPAGRRPPRRAVPVLVLFAALGIGAGLAVDALRSGRVEDAIGALLILAFVALTAWRALKSRR